MISVINRGENILGKGENAGHQHFVLFPKCFQKASFSRSGLCGKELTERNLFKILFCSLHGLTLGSSYFLLWADIFAFLAVILKSF